MGPSWGVVPLRKEYIRDRSRKQYASEQVTTAVGAEAAAAGAAQGT